MFRTRSMQLCCAGLLPVFREQCTHLLAEEGIHIKRPVPDVFNYS